MRWLLVCLTLAGCARAGKDNSIVGGIIDASALDAPEQQVRLTETASEEVSHGGSFACVQTSTGFTRENSYYRVFTLTDYSITTTLHVIQVDFGIDTATAGTGGMQPASLVLGTYGGTPDATTLDLSLVRPLASADINIRDGATRMTVPITADVAAATSLIVELAIPDGMPAGNQFLIGVNGQGERKPGYTRRPSCNVTSPATMQSIAASIGKGESDIVMTVTGTD